LMLDNTSSRLFSKWIAPVTVVDVRPLYSYMV